MKYSPLFLSLGSSLVLAQPLFAAPSSPKSTNTPAPAIATAKTPVALPLALPRSTQKEIEALLRHPGLRTAHIGLAVVALGKALSPADFAVLPYRNGAQPLLFERDANKRFTPASNFKLFTAAWVLHQLGPQKTFVTRAVQTSLLAMKVGSWPSKTPYPSVVTLYGDGDPSLSTEDLKVMATEIAAKSTGALIVRASESLFPRGNMNAEEGGGRYPDGWTLDDALWYYGAPVSSLALNRNQIDVTIKGSATLGETATVTTDPEAPFSIFAPVITVDKTDPRAGKLRWTRGDNASPLGSTLTIDGFIASGESDTEGIAVPDVRGWAQSVFGTALREKGASVVEPEGFYGQTDAVVLSQHASPPLSQLLQRFLKSSDNLYGEMLLRRAAVELPQTQAKTPDPKPAAVKIAEAKENPQIASTGLAARAHGAMLDWLKSSGIPTQGVRFSDGSGLSRYDLATPISIARLLGTVEKMETGKAFYDALPIAGVDGTLKNRMKGTAAQGNARAKTGTFRLPTACRDTSQRAMDSAYPFRS